ncbi:SRPBCC family protein [Streptomyces sp. V4-01]|uniref:SRPBCC family protein n=1 Tax=Actinacidiphila polyblastidii TaxID=3110430 RepID=A0ABU7PGT2_9ACTN|nr:SRPBCC family protein [Streptomyces sp. V4-01]
MSDQQISDVVSGGVRIIGTLRAEGARGVVRMEDVYDTDAADLWRALTEPRRLERWIADVKGELRRGGEFHIRFTSGWEGQGRVDVCEEGRRLRVTTTEQDTGDETVIEAVLTPEGAKTRLVVEERGLPVSAVANHGAGWQAHVEDLAAHLAGRERCDWHTRWEQLIPSYRDLAVARG